jgi:hypothetical protein
LPAGHARLPDRPRVVNGIVLSVRQPIRDLLRD